MNKLYLDRCTDEIFSREVVPAPQQAHSSGDVVTSVLSLISETATALKGFENQAAQSLARAQELAENVKEQLDRARLRAEHAETMLRLAEDQIEKLSCDVDRTQEELERLQAELAERTTELAASEQRADAGNATLGAIVDVIRAQFPTKLKLLTD